MNFDIFCLYVLYLLNGGSGRVPYTYYVSWYVVVYDEAKLGLCRFICRLLNVYDAACVVVGIVYFAKSMIDYRDERWDNIAQRVE